MSLVAAFLAVAACGDDPPPGDPNDVETEGGSITLEQCGYDVTTRVGASAPVLGSPLFGEDPTPRHVHLGLAGDPATSMVVQWRTNDDLTLATQVQYGPGDDLGQTQDGLTFIFISGFNQNGETVRMHETHLCGLTPDTEYSYRVGGVDADGNESWSSTYSFRTAPPVSQSDAEVVIANLGDSRDGYDVLAKFVDLLVAESPDLILFSGDAVTIGAVQDEWDVFFETGQELFARAPLVGAHGNHEVNAINYYAQWAMPGDEENYSLDYGPVHVTVLNDTPLAQSDIEGSTADFLAADLTAAAGRPWKLMSQHRSLWSASRHGSDELLQTAWGPIIDQHHVDLVLGGHDHNYERTKPMKGSEVQQSTADGTVYVVSGGAGAALYEAGSDVWTEVSAKEHSSLIVRARAGMLELEAIREDGAMLDSFTITK